jgi:sigma-E factor negative regulatory protein RseB
MNLISRFLTVLLCALALPALVLAQGAAAATGAAEVRKPVERSLAQWLMRIHEASRHGAYSGTFVVSSATGGMSSSRIWHACDGDQQIERVEALTGAPRATYRQNDQVVTFLPQSKQVIQERRDSLRLFPGLLKTHDTAISDFYTVRRLGSERVAGVDADVLLLESKDKLRFGYRIWSERDTGLVVKLQTLDNDGRTLEQSAFSELQLNAPVSMAQLSEMMHNTHGYHVEKLEPVVTTALAEGWVLKPVVPGFTLLSCLRRPFAAAPATAGAAGAPAGPVRTVQWIFSDGLASVSLFVEPLDRRGPSQEVSMVLGATRLLSRQVQDSWLTVVGEVPLQTLQLFSRSLERAR